MCPYCNRQYITSYIDVDNKKRTTADADHYYPQSKYPLLALSLYNIIPSCLVCNRTFKGNSVDEDNTLYPYNEDDISNKISFDISNPVNQNGELSCDVFYNSNNSDIKILIKCKNKEAENSNNVFKLDRIYQSHSIEIIELLNKMYIHNKTSNSDLIDISKGNLNEMNIDNFIYDFDKDNLGKKPLSKLKNDIYQKYKV